jgi:hypothetical protein
MGGHVRLDEEGGALDVDAGGEVLRGGAPGAPLQGFRVLGHGDGVQVDHAVDGIVLILEGDPVHERAEVVAEVERVARRLHAGEDDGT